MTAGRLVLVVGPSGAGKDTLIDHAKAACRDDASVVFARRVVTRAASAAEDHDTLSPEAFDDAAASGAFALWWEAHGLKYGIRADIEDVLREGCTVVCNVSRTVVSTARERYADVTVVLVTAPLDVLAARLSARLRTGDGAVTDRLSRSRAGSDDLQPDVVIDNTGSVESAAAQLVAAIIGPG